MQRYQLAVSSLTEVVEAHIDGRILGTESKFWFPRLRSNLCSATLVLGGMWVKPDEESDPWNLSPRVWNRTYQVLRWRLAKPYVFLKPRKRSACSRCNDWQKWVTLLWPYFVLETALHMCRLVHCSWLQDCWLPTWYLPISVLLMLILMPPQDQCFWIYSSIVITRETCQVEPVQILVICCFL